LSAALLGRARVPLSQKRYLVARDEVDDTQVEEAYRVPEALADSVEVLRRIFHSARLLILTLVSLAIFIQFG
jgi:hypothetical protein